MKENLKSEKVDNPSRRNFLVKFGWGGIICFLLGIAAATARFFFPRVLFESPAKFSVGKPGDYVPGKVDSSYKDVQRICLVRKNDGSFYCVSLSCTHLGCTANWKASEGIFHCACHGSKFDEMGINFAGPAPRPLDRFKISMTPEGELIVDKSVIYKGIPGMNPEEINPQSLLLV
jgi:cytochrome b6-f complex iron-sulfur subunit